MSTRTPAALRHLPPVYRARIRAARCCVCRRTREPEQAFSSLVCTRNACAQTYRRLHARRRREAVALPLPPDGLPTCSVCDWPLTPPELGQAGMWGHVVKARGVCGDASCRAEWSERRRAEADASARDAELLTRRIARHRDDAARALGVPDPDRFPVVRLPYNGRKLVNLAAERRRRFRDHLYRLISQAVLPPGTEEEEPEAEAPDVPSAALPAVIRACTMCRGNCCFHGADHAHLRVTDVRRHMAAHPEQRPRDVFAAFMLRLGERAYEHSCLFHGERGCELGELRGARCRRHFCDGLLGYQESVATGGSPRAYVVSLGDGEEAHYVPGQASSSEDAINGGAFVGDDGDAPGDGADQTAK